MAASPVEEVKARVDLVDLIGGTVALQRAGRSFRALCPFHGEKTPSFYVFPETQTWKCFGCGAGGDLFSFVMQRDNLEFGDALRDLAGRAGVTLESHTDPAREELRDRLLRANEAAALYYHALLMRQPAGQAARHYLESRGFTPETWERFTLGYAPDGGSALRQHLTGAGFTPEDLLAAGLAVEREAGSGSLRDRFRHRVTFPIRDAQARTIGFGGRTLTPDGIPKYLNSPQTELFEKGSVLYALDQARDAVRQERRAVIVEGYLDAVMAHQGGFRNVVAALGTALGPRQLQPLSRLADEIVFALDPDAAGDAATLRSLVVAREALASHVPVPTRRGGIVYQATTRGALRVAQLPDARDPDELIRTDPGRWRELIATALPVFDFLFERLPYQHNLVSPEGKTAAVAELVPALRDMADPIERAHYVQRLAAVVGVPETAIAELTRPSNRRALVQPPKLEERPDPQEEFVLALLVAGAPGGGLREDHFQRPECRGLWRWIRAGAIGEPPDGLAATWANVQALVAEYNDQSPDNLRLELDSKAAELRKRRLTQEQQEMQALARDSDGVPLRELQERFNRLAEQRRDLERAQQAHGRVMATPPRLQVPKELPRE